MIIWKRDRNLGQTASLPSNLNNEKLGCGTDVIFLHQIYGSSIFTQ